MGNLYIVATPIGNLKDITARALEILQSCDFILCEDTRVSRKLFEHYAIKTRFLSYHEHSDEAKTLEILDLLKQGKNLALITDAGTPGISDPGNKLVERAFLAGIKAVPIPGPSAMAAAASASGFPMDKFVFLGFPPAKNKRKKFFQEAMAYEIPVIFYESTHRILKSLKEAAELKPDCEMAVFRELTKKFETIYRGKPEEIIKQLERGETMGEFVVILRNKI